MPQPAAVELLATLAPVLARWGRWYVFGAQAVIVYGVPRLSADVDVTLALTPEDPERFVAEMQAAGFALRVEDQGFIRRTRVMPFIHDSDAARHRAGGVRTRGGVSRSRGTDRYRRHRRAADRARRSVIAKILAGRPKDLDDARALWQLHGHELNRDRIRHTLGLLEEAIGESDLLPAFEAIARTSRSD